MCQLYLPPTTMMQLLVATKHGDSTARHFKVETQLSRYVARCDALQLIQSRPAMVYKDTVLLITWRPSTVNRSISLSELTWSAHGYRCLLVRPQCIDRASCTIANDVCSAYLYEFTSKPVEYEFVSGRVYLL